MPRGGTPPPGKTAGRVARDSSGTPKPLLQKMIGQIFQAGLNPPVVFASDENESVGIADLASQLFERERRLTLRIFFIHPVKHRETDCLGVDQLNVFVPAPQALDNEFSEPDAHPIRTVGAVEYEDTIGHRRPPKWPRGDHATEARRKIGQELRSPEVPTMSAEGHYPP